jgi:hypothetical protein
MTPIQILTQLLNGYHLKPDELKTAKTIMLILRAELESRTRKETK